MLKVLADKFNFGYEIIFANQSWGGQQNGVWSGTIGHLVNKVTPTCLFKMLIVKRKY